MKFFYRFILIILVVLAFNTPTKAMGQFLFMQGNPLVGKAAPEFSLNMAVSGKKMSLTDYRAGNKAIIFFWATWCPHCRVQLKTLNDSKAEIESKGIKVALVDLDEDRSIVKGYVQKLKIEYDVFLDEGGVVGDQYGLVGVPTFIFVDEDGVVKAVEHSLPEDYESLFAGQS